jgi:hypothetical protein
MKANSRLDIDKGQEKCKEELRYTKETGIWEGCKE